MSETVITYCSNSDVESRLHLGDYYQDNIDVIRAVRKRAHRWILQEYRRWKVDPPEVGTIEGTIDNVLMDIEADRAAYYYIRDKMEWASEPASVMLTMNNWRDDSRTELQLHIRSQHGDKLFRFKEKRTWWCDAL